jgi:hypothetical protein
MFLEFAQLVALEPTAELLGGRKSPKSLKKRLELHRIDSFVSS